MIAVTNDPGTRYFILLPYYYSYIIYYTWYILLYLVRCMREESNRKTWLHFLFCVVFSNFRISYI